MSNSESLVKNAILGYQYIAFEWSMVAFTFVLLVNRLYVRVYLRGSVYNFRVWRWSEVLIILSWLLYLVTAVCDSLLNDMGNWDPNWAPSTMKEMARLAKLYFIESFTNFPSIYCAKGALVLFYNELTPPYTHRKLWWAIRIVGALVAIGAVEMILHAMLACYPHVTYAFDGTVTTLDELDAIDQLCAHRNEVQNLTMYAFHITTDLLVFILPFFILRFALRNISTGTKAGVYIMFGLGFLNLVCAVLTCAFTQELLTDSTISTGKHWTMWQAQNLMGMVQSATAVMIPCLAQVRFTYKRLKGGRKATEGMADDSTVGDSGEDAEKGQWFKRFRRASKSSGSESSANRTVVSRGNDESHLHANLEDKDVLHDEAKGLAAGTR